MKVTLTNIGLPLLTALMFLILWMFDVNGVPWWAALAVMAFYLIFNAGIVLIGILILKLIDKTGCRSEYEQSKQRYRQIINQLKNQK